MKNLFHFLAGMIVFAFLAPCVYDPKPVQGSSEKVDTLVWINSAGDIVSSLRGSEMAFATGDKKALDSLARVYRVKEKNILEYVIALERTNAELLADLSSKEADYFPPDTSSDCPPQVKNLRQLFSSPYYIAQVQIGDSSYMHLQAFDTLTVLWKKVKTGGIFNRRTLLQLDLSTANPDTKVYGTKAYRFQERQKRFGIGIHAGVGLSPGMRLSPVVSVGINYSPIKF